MSDDSTKRKLGPKSTQPKKVSETFVAAAEQVPRKKTSLTLDEALYTRMKVLAATTGVPIGELIERGMRKVLDDK